MVSWAYIAGFLDGDGWITKTETSSKYVENKNISYTIGMTQLITCEKYMRKIYNFMIDNGINVRWHERKQFSQLNGSGNMINLIVKHQKSAVIFLKKIRKHLLVKRSAADECIDYLEKKMEKRRRMKLASENVLRRQEKRRYWTSEDVAQLKQMLSDGFSNIYIASKMGRSVNSVSHKIYRLKIGSCAVGRNIDEP